MNKPLSLTFASSLTNLTELNSSFDSGVLRIAYAGENRNKSNISKEVFEKAIPSMHGIPVVCHYDRASNSIGGHDMEVVRDDDGSLRLVNLTVPVGFVPESAETWWEAVTETDGTEHEYLCTEVILWKREEVYRKLKADGITAQSMEITVMSGEEKDDGVFYIYNFEFTALALIGVEPCFESAALEMFTREGFKKLLSDMMQDLKDSFSMVKPSKEDDIHPQKSQTEGGERVLDEKMNLAAEYGVNVDDLDFSLEDLSIDELRERFEAMKQPEENFELNSNIEEELRHVLSSMKVRHEWGEYPRYCYVDYDADAQEVYCWDREKDWLLYGFPYSVDGDATIVDFANGRRKKYAIVDFDGEETQESPFASIYEMIEQYASNNADLEQKFQSASESMQSMTQELDELRAFKRETEDHAEAERRAAIFARFEDLAGVEAFEALRNSTEEISAEDLEEKCYAIRGRNAKPNAVFSAAPEHKPTKLIVERQHEDSEPYGGLFVEFGIGSDN